MLRCVLKNIGGKLALPVDLFRGGRSRHVALARLAAARHRFAWRLRRAWIKRARRGAPIIAVSLVEHLGDIVAAEPVIRHLRRENPGAYIVWVVRSTYRDLIDSHPDVDATLSVGCLSEWLFIRHSRAFDRVVDLQIAGRSCPVCNFQLKRSDGDERINIGNYYNFGPLLQIFCRVAGLTPLDDAPRVYTGPAVRASVDRMRLPPSYVVIHCRSNQDVRDWADEKWRELAERMLQELRIPVVEIGLTPVIAARVPGCTDLCGKLSILETAEVLRRAKLFIGIDSGPAHLANAVGTPGIILLGRYRKYDWYLPYTGGYNNGSNADVIHAEGPASTISVEEVFGFLKRRLGDVAATQEKTGAARAGSL